MSVGHYENFPVASLLLPRRLREPVAVIYRFARNADDFADEGDAPAGERLERLDAYRRELARIESGQAAESALFRALGKVVSTHRLPIQAFRDLLDAFSQDIVKPRYETFDQLLDYCRRSANPVGLLMLHLFEAASPPNIARSDAICTALQLANFWQDLEIDLTKGRIYLPREDLRRFGVDPDALASGRRASGFRALMDFEIGRTRAMLESGAPLATSLRGRIGLELRMIVQGGVRILEKVERLGGDVFGRRPTLGATDWLIMASRAARM